MNKKDIEKIIDNQRKFFLSGATLSVDSRIAALKSLRQTIKDHIPLIEEALYEDLGKSAFASYMTEVGMALDEINFMIRHVRSYARKHYVYTPIAQFPALSYVKPVPYGVVLVMSPWNYPFLLAIDPLVDAIAAGNTVVVKPSAYAPRTSEVIDLIISKALAPEYATVIQGGRKENLDLLETNFNYIFFTGSVGVGKTVMNRASERLIPVTLELGGKSPCIVDSTADLKRAARRIVFGKFLNCGQTCVAPDYVYVHEDVKEDFILELKYEILMQLGDIPIEDPAYGKIVNEKHFKRILSLIDENKVVFGGNSDPEKLKIGPTVMDNVTWDDKVMQEEIFGPVLPILTYSDINDVITLLQSKPSPLALYLFTRNNQLANLIENKVQYGGGCINDTIIQLATSEMGFGGVGHSGMGAYHGKTGFETFTHNKSMVKKSFIPDFPVRYQPYTPLKEFILKLLLK